MTWQELKGYFDFAELYDAQVKRVTKGTFVEVGVWHGRSCAYLGQKIKESGKEIRLVAVDNFIDVSVEQFEANMKACNLQIATIKSDSAEAATWFRDRSVDFVYIDADHSYEAVKRDIAAWLPKIKIGGVIAGHDRLRISVTQALEESFRDWNISGPLSWWVQI